MIIAPFNGKGEQEIDLLGLKHSDVCEPMNTQARGGFQYFIKFIDDFSRIHVRNDQPGRIRKQRYRSSEELY
ncbi:hypothetical protein V6N13_033741 [Hibiscus sabdariffa]